MQEFLANHEVNSVFEVFAAKFPLDSTRSRLHAVLTAKAGIPVLHVAAGYCSLRVARVLLSAGADERVVDTNGKRACDLVGTFQADVTKDYAKERAMRQMLYTEHPSSYTFSLSLHATRLMSPLLSSGEKDQYDSHCFVEWWRYC